SIAFAFLRKPAARQRRVDNADPRLRQPHEISRLYLPAIPRSACAWFQTSPRFEWPVVLPPVASRGAKLALVPHVPGWSRYFQRSDPTMAVAAKSLRQPAALCPWHSLASNMARLQWPGNVRSSPARL